MKTDMTLSEKFKKVFAKNYFVIKNVPKRIEGEWEERIIWEKIEQPNEDEIDSCKWEGFNTIEDCIDDILKMY